jgi:hypothetical protein
LRGHLLKIDSHKAQPQKERDQKHRDDPTSIRLDPVGHDSFSFWTLSLHHQSVQAIMNLIDFMLSHQSRFVDGRVCTVDNQFSLEYKEVWWVPNTNRPWGNLLSPYALFMIRKGWH